MHQEGSDIYLGGELAVPLEVEEGGEEEPVGASRLVVDCDPLIEFLYRNPLICYKRVWTT